MSFSRRNTIARLSAAMTFVVLLLSTDCLAAHKAAVLAPPPPADPSLIIPGSSIGRVSINEASKFLGWLGQPRNSHSAAGHYWAYYPTAVGSFDILGVYTVSNDAGNMTFVHQVWTNSPTFHTAAGDCVGCPLSQIMQDFPNARPLSTAGQNYPTGTVLYDDPQQGISFQIIHVPYRKCSAILVHVPSMPALSEPLPLPKDSRWDLSIP